MVKKLLAIVAIILAICLALYGFNKLFDRLSGLSAALDKLKETDAQAQATIAKKDEENKALAAEVAKLQARDAALEVEKAQIRTERDKALAENSKLRDELKTAPPETVLAKTQQWLGTQEIWLRANAANQVEAVFSLVAFRVNADALAEWQGFKFTLIPSLQAEIKTQAEQIKIVRQEVATKDVMLANLGIQLWAKDTQIAGRDDVIRLIKKNNLKRDIIIFFIGIAGGYFGHGK